MPGHHSAAKRFGALRGDYRDRFLKSSRASTGKTTLGEYRRGKTKPKRYSIIDSKMLERGAAKLSA